MVYGIWICLFSCNKINRKPGKIGISVSASGLTSGSFNIDTEETDPDNSVVTEPVLQDEGRNRCCKIFC